jgi:hypothetical protein
MIRNYKRVTEKSRMVKGGYERCYSVCIQNGEFIRSLSRKKGIPFTSLQERVKGVKKLNRLGLEENHLYTRAGTGNYR